MFLSLWSRRDREIIIIFVFLSFCLSTTALSQLARALIGSKTESSKSDISWSKLFDHFWWNGVEILIYFSHGGEETWNGLWAYFALSPTKGILPIGLPDKHQNLDNETSIYQDVDWGDLFQEKPIEIIGVQVVQV